MEWVFRHDLKSAEKAGEGEILLLPAPPEHRERRDLAAFVLKRGIESLIRAEGEISRIVLQEDPTLDDMVAATFVEQFLAGKEIPEGASELARYASLVREGLRPDDLPLESSIEGIYMAIRNSTGGPLTEAANAETFTDKWKEMMDVLWSAVDQKTDIFGTPLFEHGSEFARERAFLREDRDVYRQDVARGNRWIVKLPDGPPHCSALILRRPKSLLWKSWSRQDPEAPDGGAYLFLGVTPEEGQWIFSTDPVQKLPIKELAAALQEAEKKKDAEAAEADPWFDGKPFGHTLVAAPRNGTKLSDEEVIKVVKDWAGAKKLHEETSRASRIGYNAAAALLLVALGATLALLIWKPWIKKPIDFRHRGSPLSSEYVEKLKAEQVDMPGYALIIGVGEEQGAYSELNGACSGAAQVYCMLRDRYGFSPDNMRILVDRPDDAKDDEGFPVPNAGNPTLKNVMKEIRALSDRILQHQKSEQASFVFYYGGHGHKEKRARDIGYLVLSGFDPKAPDTSGYGMSQLSQFLQERIAATHQILLVDSCFSGFSVVARGVNDKSSRQDKIYELWKKRAHVLLTAGTHEQLSWEYDNRSIFTEILLDGLGEHLMADGNKDGIVTDGELAGYLQAHVPEAVDFVTNGQSTLNPGYFRGMQGDDVGQFLFVPTLESTPVARGSVMLPPGATSSAAAWEVVRWDRIIVRPQYKKQMKVKLEGIEPIAGEKNKAARQFTKSLVAGKVVTVNVTGHADRKQVLAEVILPDGRSLNEELVKAGFAKKVE